MKQLFVVIALVLAACSGSTADSTTTTVISDGQTGADAGVPGDLNPGGLDIRTLEMSDGTQITYGLILPADFDASRQYPVLLALPPGGQTVELMTSVAETTYLSSLALRCS